MPGRRGREPLRTKAAGPDILDQRHGDRVTSGQPRRKPCRLRLAQMLPRGTQLPAPPLPDPM